MTLEQVLLGLIIAGLLVAIPAILLGLWELNKKKEKSKC